MSTNSFNVIDYTKDDIAYELNSHPDFVITKQQLPKDINTCDDYNLVFIDILDFKGTLPQIIKEYFDSVKDLNLLTNIYFHIKKDDYKYLDDNLIEISKQGIIQDYNNDNEIKINYRQIDIQEIINNHKRRYEKVFNEKQLFRQIQPNKQVTDHFLTSETIQIKLNEQSDLNSVFNNIKLNEKFPMCTYYSYMKLHTTLDNENLTSDIISELNNNNNNYIVVYLLENIKKPNLFKSYIPIIIQKQKKNIIVKIDNINTSYWNTVKEKFKNIFVDITQVDEKIISSTGSFFIFDYYFNKFILSHICLNSTSNFILKNESSSLTTNTYKMTYFENNDIKININIYNKNIIGNEKIPLLTGQKLNSNYVEIEFKNTKNEGQICMIKQYINKLFSMYDNKKDQIIKNYNSLNLNIKIDDKEDKTKDNIVKSRKFAEFVNESINKPKFDYTRKCQRSKPSIVTQVPNLRNIDKIGDIKIDKPLSTYFKEDGENTIHMNWPKDSSNWLKCNDKKDKYPSVMNANNFYVPCCYQNFQLPNNLEYYKDKKVDKKISKKLDKNNVLFNLNYYNIVLNNEIFEFKTFRSLQLKVDKKYINFDLQSHSSKYNISDIEDINISLEYTLQKNIYCFDEIGNLLLPKSNKYVGNIYYNLKYNKSIYLVRNNDKYAKLDVTENSNIDQTLFNIKYNNYILNQTQLYNLPKLDNIRSQYVDSYNKCRILELEIDKKSIYCETLIPPLPIKIKKELLTDNTIQISDTKLVVQFYNENDEFVDNIEQCLDEKNNCIEIKFDYYNFKIIFKTSSPKIDDVKTYKNPVILSSQTNHFKTYKQYKDQINQLKQTIIENNSDINDNLINKFKLEEGDKQLMISKLQYFKTLYDRNVVFNKTHIENIYDITKYKEYDEQRILYISNNISSKNYNLKLKSFMINTKISIEPYFMMFKKEIYLVQETNNINNAFYISNNWNSNKFNYKLNDKLSKSKNYIIYNDKLEEIKRSNKVEGGVIQIIFIKVEDEIKFLTLLRL